MRVIRLSSARVLGIALVLALGCGLGLAQAQPAALLSQPASGVSPQPVAANTMSAGLAPSDDPQNTMQVFRSRSDEVNVIFTVTDKHGKFVKDLQQRHFTILDNNLPPQEIKGFQAETDLPLRVGLLIDASNSIRDRFQFEQRAATEFLRQVVRPQTDRAFVLAFDEVTDITQDYTNDLDKLAKGVKIIRPGGGTAMWDAVYLASRDKLMKERAESATGTVRKAIILVSDGDDNQSRYTRKDAIEMAQRAGVIVYAISTNLNNILDSGDHNLQAMAEATGGRAFFPSKLNDLTGSFKAIQEELRSQYSVSYKPEHFDANGQFRPIQILAENKKFRVRAKKGYYVPKTQ